MITITLTPNTPEEVDAVLSLLVRLRLETMPVEQAPAAEQSETEQAKPVRRTRKSAPAEQPVVDSPKEETPAPVAEQAPETPAPSQESPASPSEQTYTLEQVRARLAELSQAGKKSEVLAAMQQFGATRLTEIRPEQFGELMAAVEGL